MALLMGKPGNAHSETGPEINMDNWVKPPDILEIRKVYQEIVQGKESGT